MEGLLVQNNRSFFNTDDSFEDILPAAEDETQNIFAQIHTIAPYSIDLEKVGKKMSPKTLC